ncbi:MAG: hypothetical protein R3B70_29530 [Polyangiaceae bacterium]
MTPASPRHRIIDGPSSLPSPLRPPLRLPLRRRLLSHCAAGNSSSQVGGRRHHHQTGGGGTGGTDLVGGFTATGGAGDPAHHLHPHQHHPLRGRLPSPSRILAVTEIGPIDCIGGAGEDTSHRSRCRASGEIWGISKTNHLSASKSPAAPSSAPRPSLSTTRRDIRFYGFTFAPKGVLDPDAEGSSPATPLA